MAIDNYFEENNVSIPVMLRITDKSGELYLDRQLMLF